MADGSLIFDTKLDASGLSTGLGKLGGVAGAAFKGVAVAAGAAAGAVGYLTKAALDGYSAYEQLTGGVETLFKSSSDTVMQYANNAYKTAGMSANAYMETVTSFSASLIQSLGGDTVKAAEYANMAITDMSDNANKMGTDIGMIQNAYNGFAKGNFTMLDNLKLGYGGTRAEMQRLLKDAQAISGIEYDVSSYADVVDAIHVIQNEMGIAGTTAKEASSTIEGSLASMKAAWSNLVVGIADDNADLDALIGQFVDSVTTAASNILPRIEIILNGIGQLIQSMLPVLLNMIPSMIEGTLPQLLAAGVAIVDSLMTGITQNLGSLLALALDVVMQLVNVILNNLPRLIEVGLQAIVQLALGIAAAIPTLVPTLVNVVISIVQVLISNLPMILDAALQLMQGLVDGLLAALPVLIAALPAIILAIVDFIIGAIPQIIDAGIMLLTSLVEALPTIIEAIVAAIPQIIDGIITALINSLPQIVDAGIRLLVALIEALPVIISVITGAMPQITSSIINALIGNIDQIILAGVQLLTALIENLPQIIVAIVKAVPPIISGLVSAFASGVGQMADAGVNLVKGLWQGISSSLGWIKSKISGWVGNVMSFVKGLFGIASPSKKFKYIGEMCVAGFDEGMEDLMDGSAITRSMNASVNVIKNNTSSAGGALAGGFNQTINVNREISTPDELARAVRLETRYGLMKGVALA